MNTKKHSPPILTSPFDLTIDDTNEFKELFYKQYQIKLTSDQAKKQATRLLLTIRTVFKPITKSIDNSP